MSTTSVVDVAADSPGRWPTPWCVASEYGGVGQRYEAITVPSIVLKQAQRLASLVRSGG